MTGGKWNALGEYARALGEGTCLGTLVGVAAGAASAVFLQTLAWATRFREAHEAIVYTLPVAGLVIGALYGRFGASIASGNNLVIDTLHEERPRIPLRMAPMVLVGTVLTHLFGGSAGREGTAVQMGASLADGIAHLFGVTLARRRQLIAAGIAGGFGSVFGTPCAGVLFGLEVATVGALDYRALLPALVASFVGDRVTRALGVAHTTYPSVESLALSPRVAASWMVIGLAVAATAVTFVELTHALKKQLARWVPSLALRMLLGGGAVVALWQIAGTDRYLGLGVPTIVAAFTDPTLPTLAFAWKLLFTVVTLSAGFLGGEVTPLFFVGGTLGAVLARALGVPVAMGAAVGMAALFGAAANTPLALCVMAVELFGAPVLPHALIVAVVAYLASGHRGIYTAQRLQRWKHGGEAGSIPLRDL